jgi:hypothetical protein
LATHLWSRNTHKISGGFRCIGKNYEIQISLVDKARHPDSITSPSRRATRSFACQEDTSTWVLTYDINPRQEDSSYDWLAVPQRVRPPVYADERCCLDEHLWTKFNDLFLVCLVWVGGA